MATKTKIKVLILTLMGTLGSITAFADYTVTNRLEVLGTIDPAEITNGYQSVSVVSKSENTTTIDVKYHPYYQPPTFVPNVNWQIDDLPMSDYLKPGLTANWDNDFRVQLISDLAEDGIFPEQLDDVSVVQKVSKWLLAHKMGKGPFIHFFVDFKNGLPFVPDSLRSAFNHQLKEFGLATDEEAFNLSLYGKGLYQNNSASSCTPAAILWATVFRALGIPTRILENIPAIDRNDPSELSAISSEIHKADILQAMITGFSGIPQGSFASHTFNEVFVGGRWARLNYDQLDQPIVDEHYMGLLTQIATMNDWSEANLSDSWGARYANSEYGIPLLPSMTSVNPYFSINLFESQ